LFFSLNKKKKKKKKKKKNNVFLLLNFNFDFSKLKFFVYFLFHLEQTVAGSLQAAKISLEQEKKRESLGRKVSTRPSKQSLQQQHIIPGKFYSL
jgi:hypothetical protein